jgi:2-amino-4-hydroxy-6-hydroxymethyldihydropteridine diphosphokinase
MLHVVIGLGANLGDPPAAFAAALAGLGRIGEVVSVSRLWRTRPVGPGQPDYCNAAVLLDWPGDPTALLGACRELEATAGRNRAGELRWGPRVLDLDLLVARDLVWRGPELEVPHPRFHERAFALVPAAELVPDWVHPMLGRTIAELADEVRAAEPSALLSSEPFPFARNSPRES